MRPDRRFRGANVGAPGDSPANSLTVQGGIFSLMPSYLGNDTNLLTPFSRLPKLVPSTLSGQAMPFDVSGFGGVLSDIV